MADIFHAEFDSTEETAEEDFPVLIWDGKTFVQNSDGGETESNDDQDVEQKESTSSEENVDSIVMEPSESKTTLEELANSDFIRNRQLAAQSIVEYLHQAGSNKEALHSVISIMCKLSEDEDFMVRSELIEHIPSIALFCKYHSEDLGVVIRQQLVPYTVKQLTDNQIQVRKMGHTALLVLLQHNVIDNSQLSEWICPLLSQLITSGNTSEELRCEDVSVMCKMIPYVGKEITEKFFLEPFISLCCDPACTIRKICALNIGSICKVVQTESTESTLLPAFLNLCSDEVWGIRKECADVFVDVATIVSYKTREDVLLHIFINLLDDDTRYVALAAYQSLGGFISTFAHPQETSIYFDDCPQRSRLCQFSVGNETECTDCKLDSGNVLKEKEIIGEIQGNCVNFNVQHSNKFTKTFNPYSLNTQASEISEITSHSEKVKTYLSHKGGLGDQINDENLNVNMEITEAQNTLNSQKIASNPSSLSSVTKNVHLHLRVNNENVFNNFQFWRTPLPEIELDIDSEEGKVANTQVKMKVQSEVSAEICAPELNGKITQEDNSRNYVLQNTKVAVERVINETGCINPSNACMEELKKSEFVPVSELELKFRNLCYTLAANHKMLTKKAPAKDLTVHEQDIVPPELLARFISSEERKMPNEDEKTLYCAYSFPAVAYTLGWKYWPCIRNLYSILARDIRCVVRKTIASSLHELADIICHDNIVEDLLPVFVEMLKDVDEVRIKVLMHLYDFLKHLRPQERRQFLPLIEEFFTVERESNWRFRFTVADQLIPCVKLFSSSEIQSHFLPVPLSLMHDKASDVRRSAVELVAVIIKTLVADCKTPFYFKTLLSVFDARYRQANKWLRRQTYVFFCQELANKQSLPTDVYVDEVVPNLFSLAWDTVPNVRLAVSRCIGLTLLPLGYLPSIHKTHYSILQQVMYSLQNDVDKDVRHFAHLSAGALNVLPQKKLSPV